MKVLSLFNGYGGGLAALDALGIMPDLYLSSEIDRAANTVFFKNYPAAVDLGDVRGVRSEAVGDLDLLLGGSPCQGFSYAGRRLNFEDPRSRLFFEYVRILEETKPRFFLLENVMMGKKERDIISGFLGVDPVFICSSRLVPQKRPRLYWTNIPGVRPPRFSAPPLSSIVGENLEAGKIVGRRLNSDGRREDENKDLKNIQCLEVRKAGGPSNCLTTFAKDNVLTPLPPGRYPEAFSGRLPWRYYLPEELEQLQGLPVGYTAGVSRRQREKMIGNGWTVPIISHILKNIQNPAGEIRRHNKQMTIF